jgi:serine/threonine protein kinase
MPKKVNDTIKLNDSDNHERADDTIRLDDDTNVSNQTQRVETVKIVKAGLGGGIKLSAGQSNIYKLNDIDYRIIHKISDSTSEAQIYLIEKDADQFILKYYYPFIKPKLAVIDKLRKISHPDIISVIDYGYHNERFFEILSYADQGSLADQIPIKDKSRIRKFVSEIANALKYCHDNGIIHRDIKPSNIFLTNGNQQDVLIGDFGIASIVEEGEALKRTTIFQTPIYSAPEFKMSLRGETIITKAVDYYSLGITIWELAAGSLPPEGMDELEFLREMFEGNPPLPKNMDEDIAALVKGLTFRGYKQRWGYEEVIKWLDGGAPKLPSEDKISVRSKFIFGEDEKGNDIIAETNEELARLVYENPELGRKHLYRGTIKEWLKQNGDQNLFLEIADITEYKYIDDEITGTQYAVYILDKNFPYYSLKNKPLKTKQQLVDELRFNWKIYSPALKDPNHKFYLYLLSKNAHQDVEKFRLWYNEKEEEYAFYHILYTLEFSLNKNAPFAIFTSGKLKKLVTTLEELSDYFIQNPKSRKPLYLSADFWVWLSFKDKEIKTTLSKLYEEENGASKNLLGQLPHLLLPGLGYKGLSGKRAVSLMELGEEFYNNFEEYKKIFRNEEAEIYYYLKANGLDGEISFIKKCFKPDNKPTPFTENLAMIKIIKGFEYDLPYIHREKKYYSPEELLNNLQGSSSLKNELSDQTSFLNLWLSVFYHEKPLSDDKKFYIYYREDFENQIEEYLKFIEQLYRSNEITKRYESAKNKVKSLRNKFSNFNSHRLLKKIIIYSLPLIPAVMLLLYSIFVKEIPLPGNVFTIGSWYYFAWSILVTAFLFKVMKDSNDIEFTTGCVGGPILGIVAAISIYYLFLITLYFPILLFIVLAGAFYFLFQNLHYFIEDYFEELEFEMDAIDINGVNDLVYSFTFQKIDRISVQESDLMREAKSDTNKARLKMLALSIIPALLLGVILFLLIYFTPDFNVIEIIKGN